MNHTDIETERAGLRIPAFRPFLPSNTLRYVTDCVESGWISSSGAYVARFEREFAAFCGASRAVATTNGTAALHLVLAALGIGPGDEVLVPDLTFVATANAVTYCGATAVPVDVDPLTWTLSVADAAAKLSSRTKAIIPVHLYGHPADMDPILDLARRRGCRVIEDAAHAHGAQYKGRPVGAIGDAGVFSFYANKIFTTGEGGMLVTNSDALADRASHLRDHAMDPGRRYYHAEVGFNYRMTNVQAAIGCAHLDDRTQVMSRCHAVGAAYARGLADLDAIALPMSQPWAARAPWVCAIQLSSEGPSPEELASHLASHGIDSRPFFVPLHELPPYASASRFPSATAISRCGLTLPSGPGISDDDVAAVCEALRTRLTGAARGLGVRSSVAPGGPAQYT